MQVSMFGQLSGAGTDSPIDACVQNLAQLRDEGFRRVWISQLPYEPDLLTVLAVALREIVTTRGALMIAGAPRPDVYTAALGPQLLKIAGRRTAGTATWMTGPKTLAGHVVPSLRQAAADAGRQESDVRVVASLPVAVTDDVDGARKR
ncbi:MAG: 5,10-methylenetetrahydromethanopterin reductase, partial [Mycobacterium sp.]|nr:5,10-methylenetetrahydromethanopterin reductase [Mycobacterium sp.]